MKKKYEKLLQKYLRWLNLLGYSESTYQLNRTHIGEYLEWLSAENQKLNGKSMESFMGYYKTRPNKRRGGGLSVSHINRQIVSLKKLCEYLELSKGKVIVAKLKKEEKVVEPDRVILSELEIKSLYASTGSDLLGLRDRAMLGIYYGCGLRRSEGVNLDVDAINYERRLLLVKKSKTGRQRYVPIALKILQDLESYVHESRPYLLGVGNTSALLISARGKRIQGQSLNIRLKSLVRKSGIDKELGLHNLRYSIGSHLLKKGLRIEEVSQFLGHESLDSTQLYTSL